MRSLIVLPVIGVAALLWAAKVVPPGQDIEIRSASLRTGVTLQYADVGPADGSVVVFLHGFTDSWYSFSRVLERLPEGIRAIVPTQRGHGDSDRPVCCYRIEDFAADVVALLDAVDVERATVVGHSMGSFVAQRLAIEYAERVDRLVLIGSGTTGGNDLLRELQRQVEALSDPVPMEFVREFQASTVYRPVPEAFMRRVVHESRQVPSRVWRAALAGQMAANIAADLPRVTVPTLLVSGDRDDLFPGSEQEALVARIPGAVLLTYQETGHAPHWEQPDRFVRDLIDFFRTP